MSHEEKYPVPDSVCDDDSLSLSSRPDAESPRAGEDMASRLPAPGEDMASRLPAPGEDTASRLPAPGEDMASRLPTRLESVGREIMRDIAVPIVTAQKRTARELLENRPGEFLRKKILALPDEPGVYLYLDKHGNVIYVGKAKRLKRRVASYFNRHHDALRTNVLVRNIVDLRFVVVATEEDALHLESAMIKEYQPRYNILLKDDKSYPWIEITSEPYPRIFMTRDKGAEPGRYYGPYSNVQSAREVLNLIRRIFPVRSCRHSIDSEWIAAGKGRLCLDYHIHKCGGCCKGLISEKEYGAYIRQIRRILNGEISFLLSRLKEEMDSLSEQWRFEEAAEVKQRYEIVEKYRAKSTIAAPSEVEYDIFSYDENELSAYVGFMHIRHGAVVQSLNLEYRKRLDESREEILSEAVGEVASRLGVRFEEIVAPFVPDTQFEGMNVVVPQRGDKRKLLDVGMKNIARYRVDKEKEREAADPQEGTKRLMLRMQADFRLASPPTHIECFDNSNIQGTNPVASCVVFRNGKPARREYRHFNIATVVGADDFASMKEVLHRRYTRLMAEGEELPQLVVVDGGKGQLNAAVEAFEEMGLRGVVALVGIAKRLEEIYFPGDQIPLYIDKKSESLRVVQALRDEAHRFGITHHRNRRSKSQIRSELDNVKGIGPKSAALLIGHFKSVKRLREAPMAEIEALVGKSKAAALAQGLGIAPEGEPASIAPKEEPAEIAPKGESAEIAPKEEPAEIELKKESAENAPKEEPAGIAPKEESAEIAPEKEPAEIEPKEESAEIAPKEEPAEIEPKEEP